MKYWSLICCLSIFQLAAWAQEIPFTTILGDDCHLGLVDMEGKELLPTAYATIDIVPVGNAYLVSTKVKQTAAFFLYQGNELISLPYPMVERFNDRLLKVGEQNKWGLINTAGKGVAVMNYQAITPAGVDAAITLTQEAYGVLDIDGKTVLTSRYQSIKYWEGNGFLAREDNTYSYYNIEGVLQVNTDYTAVQVPSGTWGICGVSKNGQWGVMDKNAEVVIPIKYQKVAFFESGIIAVQLKNERWELFKNNGEQLIEGTFEQVQAGGKTGCLVQQGQRYGLIGADGLWKLPLKSNLLVYTNQNCLLQQKEAVWQVINLETLTLSETEIEDYQYQNSWTGLLIQLNKQWGWMNFDGTITLPPSYTAVSAIDKNTILVTGENKKLGAISTKGKQLLPMEYIAIVPKGLVYKVQQAGAGWYYIDKNGKRKTCQVY